MFYGVSSNTMSGSTFGVSNGMANSALSFATVTDIRDTDIRVQPQVLLNNMNGWGLVDKQRALYPFVSDGYIEERATQHKYNLINPADTNAAFRLAFSGGWTHSATGAKPNGINALADTFFIPNNNFSLNSAAIGTYLRTNSSSGTDIGVVTSAGAQRAELWSKYVDGNFYTSLNNGTYESVAVANSAAFFVTSRTASNVLKSYRNTTIIKNVATVSTTMATRSIYLASINGAIFYSDKEQAFTFFADGLSDTEESNLYNIVQAFQTSLSRNV